MPKTFVCEDALDRLQEKITGMAHRSGIGLGDVVGWGLMGDSFDIPVLRFHDAATRTIFKRNLKSSPNSELSVWFEERKPALLLKQTIKHDF